VLKRTETNLLSGVWSVVQVTKALFGQVRPEVQEYIDAAYAFLEKFGAEEASMTRARAASDA